MSATKIGIWMDHQHAFVTEFTTSPMKSTELSNVSSGADKHALFAKGENHKHTKEQHLQIDFYNKLAEIMRRYEVVLIYGPTEAKDELLNRVSSDQSFSKVKVTIKGADKMTENERHAFVREYFTKHLL